MAEKYYNPQEDPGSEKRTFIVIAFTLLLLVGAQFYFKSPQPPAEKTPAAAAPAANPTVAASPTASPVAPAPDSKGKTSQRLEIETKQAASESETVIENGLYKITFSNRGGQVCFSLAAKDAD